MLAFVLGGGGSRGALQVGALDLLIREGIVPDLIIGTSIGAVNGVMVAANPTPEGTMALTQACLSLKDSDLVGGWRPAAFWNVVRRNKSLFPNESWRQFIAQHAPVERFGELKIPTYAVATDLETGEPTLFGRDPDDTIIDGLMSSTALTPLYPPWHVNERAYIDGATTAVLPIRNAVELGATHIIALNLTTQLQPLEELQSIVGMVTHATDLMLQRQVASDIEWANAQPTTNTIVVDLKASRYISSTQLGYAAMMIATGRELTRQMLPEIHAMLAPSEDRPRSWQKWFKQQQFNDLRWPLSGSNSGRFQWPSRNERRH